ncbi:MAG: hypothetical protein QOE92_1521 [Chloroflexota bacterium]|jgi:pimeloyl-ACP methyl ester carboxylesterase|nr:hypothetical protein [Chloroflexota bacterium]
MTLGASLSQEREALVGATSRWADIDGPIHYADFGGPGQPVVAVHGLGGSHVAWMMLGPLLAPTVRLLAIDLVGFGLTPLAGRSASVDANQEVLDRFIQQVVGAPCPVIGHSMGGFISMLQAGRRPATISSLVLVDPACPPAGEVAPILPAPVARLLLSRPRLANVTGTVIAMLAGPRVLVDDAIRRAVADFDAVPERLLTALTLLERERLQRGLAYVGYGEARLSFGPYWRDPAAFDRDVVGAVSQPTTMVIGETDTVIPVTSMSRVAGTRPDWHVERLPGIGHDPIFECPERVAEIVIGSLALRRAG